MKPEALVVILFIFLNGCVSHSRTYGNLEFYRISQISELAGVYKNTGDSSVRLSAILWGHAKLKINPEVSHTAIEFIEVLSTENSLIVKAIKSGCAIYEESYILGRDFNISGGIITKYRDVFFLGRGPGDVILGPSFTKITLGLDAEKHIKYRHSNYLAGLAMLLIPTAHSETSESRFERVNDRPPGFKACDNDKKTGENSRTGKDIKTPKSAITYCYEEYDGSPIECMGLRGWEWKGQKWAPNL